MALGDHPAPGLEDEHGGQPYRQALAVDEMHAKTSGSPADLALLVGLGIAHLELVLGDPPHQLREQVVHLLALPPLGIIRSHESGWVPLG